MDFLNNLKAKLEELEREAQRAMQEQQLQQTQARNRLFQPKPDDFEPERPRKHRQDPPPRSSRRPVDSEVCPVEEVMGQSSESGPVSHSGVSILDDLQGRLEEAFLLQEILGAPRCVKGWNE
ncbi:MAG: hypothetical protein WC314_11890 [Vulcanimicrobiota bacterium]